MAGDTTLPLFSNLFIFPVRMESISSWELSLASLMKFPFPPPHLPPALLFFTLSHYVAIGHLGSSRSERCWSFLLLDALLKCSPHNKLWGRSRLGLRVNVCVFGKQDATQTFGCIGINIFRLPVKCRLWTENKAYSCINQINRQIFIVLSVSKSLYRWDHGISQGE